MQKLWRERGKPICIFVWEDGEQSGQAFRINPLLARDVQRATVPVKLLLQYDNAGGCSKADVERHFLVAAELPVVQTQPEDVSTEVSLEALEGLVHEARVLSRGRNAALRTAALTRSNGTCGACLVVFSNMLGGMGRRVLHVHHREQLSLREVPSVTRLEDLAVVCANCHALIHADPRSALAVEQVREMLAAESRDA